MMNLRDLPNKRNNEQIHLFLRRHWIEVFRIVFVFVLLFGVPIVLAYVLRSEVRVLLAHPFWGPILAIVTCLYVLGAWLVSFIDYTDYYLDTWIVTDERIINIEQHGLFRRTASELHLADIQDVTSDIHGLLEIGLDYGDVFVQTAGQTNRFNFKNVPHPEKVKQLVLQLVEADRRRHKMGSAISEPQTGGPVPLHV